MLYVVDDGEDYRFLLQQIFTRFLPQYSARQFASGNALQEHIQTEPEGAGPSLILLDLNMPGLSGLQTLVLLKQSLSGEQPSRWSSVPVVMMSNSASSQDIEACYRAGANSFLVKPADFDELRTLIEATCRYWLEMNQPSRM